MGEASISRGGAITAGWIRFRMLDGTSYYYSLNTGDVRLKKPKGPGDHIFDDEMMNAHMPQKTKRANSPLAEEATAAKQETEVQMTQVGEGNTRKRGWSGLNIDTSIPSAADTAPTSHCAFEESSDRKVSLRNVYI